MQEKQLRRVLVVDDEPNIVNAVRRELSSPPFIRYRYEVEGFTDPALALARAGEQAFDVVISDYRMPAMDGLTFLKALAPVQPDCARIVLSGQTDMDGLVRMINETHIYRFVPKPWHDYYLKGSVAQALDYFATLVEHKRLAELVRGNPIQPSPEPERAVEQLLIVDDDPQVLSSLSRVLTHHSKRDDLFAAIRTEIGQASGPQLQEDRVNVQGATSPRQALKMAEATDFSCIIADYRMPEMDGIELLERFSDLYPDCARILISGQIGEDDLIKAVGSAGIFAYIAKPWTDFELKAQIALALSRRQMLKENRLLADMVKMSRQLG